MWIWIYSFKKKKNIILLWFFTFKMQEEILGHSQIEQGMLPLQRFLFIHRDRHSKDTWLFMYTISGFGNEQQAQGRQPDAYGEGGYWNYFLVPSCHPWVQAISPLPLSSLLQASKDMWGIWAVQGIKYIFLLAPSRKALCPFWMNCYKWLNLNEWFAMISGLLAADHSRLIMQRSLENYSDIS